MQRTDQIGIIEASSISGNSMLFRLLPTTTLAGLAIVTLSSCVYRMDIPQGNRIETAVVQQLQVGMSRSQVEFLMGTPAIVDLYRPDQWHYVYFLKTGTTGNVEKKRMILTFSDDLLASIDGALEIN